MAFRRYRHACGRVHRSKNGLEDPRDDLAVSFGLQPESIDHDIENTQSQREPVVVSEVGVTDRIASPHSVERQGMEEDAEPACEIGRPPITHGLNGCGT